MLPQAIYIPDGNWIIAGTDPLVFTVTCLNSKTYEAATQPPIFHLSVAEGCEAYSDRLKLPTIYHGESPYEKIDQHSSLLTLQNSSFLTPWRPLDNITDLDVREVVKLPELDEVQDVPLDNLINKIHQLQQPTKLRPKSWLKQSWEYLTYFVVVLTLLYLIVLVLWLRSKRIRLKLTRLVQTMGNLKIEKTDTVQTADLEDVENVDEGAASTPI